jgi:hypothetical protein
MPAFEADPSAIAKRRGKANVFKGPILKCAIAAAFIMTAPAGLKAQVAITPAGGGYSVVFPEQPQEKDVALSPQVKTKIYSVNRNDAAFLAGYTEYSENMDVEKEMAADVQSFVVDIPAQIADRTSSTIELPDGKKVQRVDFSFDGQKAAGRGIIIMPTPRSSIMIAALTIKPAGKPSDVDEFVKSFKLGGQQ